MLCSMPISLYENLKNINEDDKMNFYSIQLYPTMGIYIPREFKAEGTEKNPTFSYPYSDGIFTYGGGISICLHGFTFHLDILFRDFEDKRTTFVKGGIGVTLHSGL